MRLGGAVSLYGLKSGAAPFQVVVQDQESVLKVPNIFSIALSIVSGTPT
jgi:hypothetical protein